MKKKVLLTLTVVMLGLFGLVSCQSKEERTISKLEQLSERIEENGDSYDVEEWSGIMKELEDISDDINDCKFTSKQMEEVGRLQAKFYKVVMKNCPKLFSGALSSFGSYAKGLKEGLMDDSDGKGLQEQFDDMEDAMNEAMKSFEDELNNLDENFNEEMNKLSDELDGLLD